MNRELVFVVEHVGSDDRGRLYIDGIAGGEYVTYALDLQVDECLAFCRELIHVAELRLQRLANPFTNSQEIR